MRAVLRGATGRFTMYSLAVTVLGAIAAVSVMLSIVGRVAYSPLELVASLVVAVLSTLGAGAVAGRIVGVPPHRESGIITGLILFLIMQPTTTAVGLGGVAAAGILATASKYLLAIRGRHLFNPAALGAFVPTTIVFAAPSGPVAGMSFAAWWVGTPWLAVVVGIGAVAVLQRSQRLLLGGVFVVAASGLAVIVAVIGGQDAGAAVTQVLLQSPVLFFAGFMLSEPLTLAPRRWQYLLEALVVAALFAVPLPIGQFSASPLVALLVGNLIGFSFGQRRSVRLRYAGSSLIGPQTREFAFDTLPPARFTAGQYLELYIPHRGADRRGTRRHLTISSPPYRGEQIAVTVKMPERPSTFKAALASLEPGSVVRATQIGGDFTLPRNQNVPLLLIAGGIGITPFASQLAQTVASGHTRDIVLVYAVSNTDRLPFEMIIESSGARVVLFGSRTDTLPSHWVHGGEGRMTDAALADTIPDLARRRAYISGPPSFISEGSAMLRSAGVRRIRTDSFSGY